MKSPHEEATSHHESGHRFDADSVRLRFFAQSLAAVRTVPGVASAAFTRLLPLSGDQFGEYGVEFENGATRRRSSVFLYSVSPGYCETMGIPLLRGRLLDEHDVAGALPDERVVASVAHRSPHRPDAWAAQFSAPVPADGSVTLRYRVRVTY